MNTEEPTMQLTISDCLITITFMDKPVDNVLENIQSILKHAYEKRVQNDLAKAVNPY